MFLIAGLIAAALALPASASAASVTITGDGGEAVGLTEGAGAQLRNMSPVVTAAFDPSEKRYGLQILGPNGQSVGLASTCSAVDGGTVSDTTKYGGNGTYTVKLYTSTVQDDVYCDQGTTRTFTFTITAGTSLTAPATTLLLHQAGNSSTIEHVFRVATNPGASGYGIRIAKDASIGANGDLVSSDGVGEIDVDRATGNADVSFPTVGRFKLIAWAFAGDGSSPFSGPVDVKVMAPFDLSDKPYFADARGPSYKMRGKFVDRTAIEGQKVTVSLAKGKGKFRRIATPKVDDFGSFEFKFKQKGSGRYRVKVAYGGGDLMQAGSAIRAVKLGRNALIL